MAQKLEVIDLLLKQGLITQEKVNKAKDETMRTGLSVEKALEKLGFITEDEIANVRASALGVPYMDLSDYIIDAELIKLIPESFAMKYRVVPLFKIGDNLTVAMSDPGDIVVLDQIRRQAKIDIVEPVLALEKGIQKIIDSYYSAAGSVEDIVKSVDKDKFAQFQEKDLVETSEETPIVKLVNLSIAEAVKEKASDIHIEPSEDITRIRYRIDGILHEINTVPKSLHRAIVSRIKILSKMDIAESRRPQDGKVRLNVEGRNIDIRVSTFPTVQGENIVMRLLDKTSVLLGLVELGFIGKTASAFEKLIRSPNGIILVTGPTGSGKTTTLYSALSTINSMEKNIITIEDPVEYELPLIRQTQVNPKADITFANGLRSILRQDPDIVMVGEIRDKETAEVAIQAALTGHLVFSTLHTNDAPSAITRLIDMGIEPFLISSSVIGVLAQRLVRKICEKCKEKFLPSEEVLKSLGVSELKTEFYRGAGCGKCKHVGFRGRCGIHELLVVNEDIRKLIDARASSDMIKKKAIERGMLTLRTDGLEKARKGWTTLEEVVTVTEIE